MLVHPTCQAAFNGAAASQGRQTTVWTQFDSTGDRLTGRSRHTVQLNHQILEPEAKTRDGGAAGDCEGGSYQSTRGSFLPTHWLWEAALQYSQTEKRQRKMTNFRKKCFRRYLFYLLIHSGHLSGLILNVIFCHVAEQHTIQQHNVHTGASAHIYTQPRNSKCFQPQLYFGKKKMSTRQTAQGNLAIPSVGRRMHELKYYILWYICFTISKSDMIDFDKHWTILISLFPNMNSTTFIHE